jgi:molecular chaperone DnaK (HSP70)
MVMRPAFGGIDFGTSNSTVGVVRDGHPRLVALEDGQVTLPSAVFFNFEDNRIRFGRDAIANYTDSVEGRLMRSLKSVLGSSLAHEKTRIKSRSIGFMEIVGMFLGHLRFSAGRCSSSTTMPRQTRKRRTSWKTRRSRRASGISPSSSSRSPRRSTTSAR